jgi:hypothetical protein
MPYPEPPPQLEDRSVGMLWLVLVVLAALGLLAPFLL